MSRYIDADAFEKQITNRYFYIDVVPILDKTPTADVVERKWGEWIAVNIDVQSWTVQCSNCHCIGLYGQTAYCPNCGAEMRKEVEK